MFAGYYWWQYGQALWNAAVFFLVNPMVYVATLLLIWDSVRRSRVQKKFFGIHISGIWRPLFPLAGLSFGLGLCLSVGLLLAGAVVRPGEIWIAAALTVLLGLARLRYAASLYGISLFLLLVILSRFSVYSPHVAAIRWILSTLRHASLTSWLMVAAGLALCQWMLLLLRRAPHIGPALVSSGRGRAIGAVFIQSSAVLPVLTLQSGTIALHSYAWWWPLGASGVHSVSLIAAPLLFGVSGIFSSLTIRKVGVLYRRYSFLLGVLLAADSFLVFRYAQWLAWIGAAAIWIVLEIAHWHIVHLENEGDALLPASQEGVRVLGIVPKSVAATMGLAPGEIIRKVNQVAVHSSYDLHFALDQNPAYAKLEVLDVSGELRIVGKPVYTGERNKLGLILLPDGPGSRAYGKSGLGWLKTLSLREVAVTGGYGEVWSHPDSTSLKE